MQGLITQAVDGELHRRGAVKDRERVMQPIYPGQQRLYWRQTPVEAKDEADVADSIGPDAASLLDTARKSFVDLVVFLGQPQLAKVEQTAAASQALKDSAEIDLRISRASNVSGGAAEAKHHDEAGSPPRSDVQQGGSTFLTQEDSSATTKAPSGSTERGKVPLTPRRRHVEAGLSKLKALGNDEARGRLQRAAKYAAKDHAVAHRSPWQHEEMQRLESWFDGTLTGLVRRREEMFHAAMTSTMRAEHQRVTEQYARRLDEAQRRRESAEKLADSLQARLSRRSRVWASERGDHYRRLLAMHEILRRSGIQYDEAAVQRIMDGAAAAAAAAAEAEDDEDEALQGTLSSRARGADGGPGSGMPGGNSIASAVEMDGAKRLQALAMRPQVTQEETARRQASGREIARLKQLLDDSKERCARLQDAERQQQQRASDASERSDAAKVRIKQQDAELDALRGRLRDAQSALKEAQTALEIHAINEESEELDRQEQESRQRSRRGSAATAAVRAAAAAARVESGADSNDGSRGGGYRPLSDGVGDGKIPAKRRPHPPPSPGGGRAAGSGVGADAMQAAGMSAWMFGGTAWGRMQRSQVQAMVKEGSIQWQSAAEGIAALLEEASLRRAVAEQMRMDSGALSASTQKPQARIQDVAAGRFGIKQAQSSPRLQAASPAAKSLKNTGSFLLGEDDGAESEYQELLHASEVLRGRVHALENDLSEAHETIAREREEYIQEKRQRESKLTSVATQTTTNDFAQAGVPKDSSRDAGWEGPESVQAQARAVKRKKAKRAKTAKDKKRRNSMLAAQSQGGVDDAMKENISERGQKDATSPSADVHDRDGAGSAHGSDADDDDAASVASEASHVALHEFQRDAETQTPAGWRDDRDPRKTRSLFDLVKEARRKSKLPGAEHLSGASHGAGAGKGSSKRRGTKRGSGLAKGAKSSEAEAQAEDDKRMRAVMEAEVGRLLALNKELRARSVKLARAVQRLAFQDDEGSDGPHSRTAEDESAMQLAGLIVDASQADAQGVGGEGEGEGKDGGDVSTRGMSGAAAEVLLDDIQRLRRRVNQLVTSLKNAGLAVPAPARRGAATKEGDLESEEEDKGTKSPNRQEAESSLSPEQANHLTNLQRIVTRMLLPSLARMEQDDTPTTSGERNGSWAGATVRRIELALGKLPRQSRLDGLNARSTDGRMTAAGALADLTDALRAREHAAEEARSARWKGLVLARMAMDDAPLGASAEGEGEPSEAHLRQQLPAATIRLLQHVAVSLNASAVASRPQQDGEQMAVGKLPVLAVVAASMRKQLGVAIGESGSLSRLRGALTQLMRMVNARGRSRVQSADLRLRAVVVSILADPSIFTGGRMGGTRRRSTDLAGVPSQEDLHQQQHPSTSSERPAHRPLPTSTVRRESRRRSTDKSRVPPLPMGDVFPGQTADAIATARRGARRMEGEAFGGMDRSAIQGGGGSQGIGPRVTQRTVYQSDPADAVRRQQRRSSLDSTGRPRDQAAAVNLGGPSNAFEYQQQGQYIQQGPVQGRRGSNGYTKPRSDALGSSGAPSVPQMMDRARREGRRQSLGGGFSAAAARAQRPGVYQSDQGSEDAGISGMSAGSPIRRAAPHVVGPGQQQQHHHHSGASRAATVQPGESMGRYGGAHSTGEYLPSQYGDGVQSPGQYYGGQHSTGAAGGDRVQSRGGSPHESYRGTGYHDPRHGQQHVVAQPGHPHGRNGPQVADGRSGAYHLDTASPRHRGQLPGADLIIYQPADEIDLQRKQMADANARRERAMQQRQAARRARLQRSHRRATGNQEQQGQGQDQQAMQYVRYESPRPGSQSQRLDANRSHQHQHQHQHQQAAGSYRSSGGDQHATTSGHGSMSSSFRLDHRASDQGTYAGSGQAYQRDQPPPPVMRRHGVHGITQEDGILMRRSSHLQLAAESHVGRHAQGRTGGLHSTPTGGYSGRGGHKSGAVPKAGPGDARVGVVLEAPSFSATFAQMDQDVAGAIQRRGPDEVYPSGSHRARERGRSTTGRTGGHQSTMAGRVASSSRSPSRDIHGPQPGGDDRFTPGTLALSRGGVMGQAAATNGLSARDTLTGTGTSSSGLDNGRGAGRIGRSPRLRRGSQETAMEFNLRRSLHRTQSEVARDSQRRMQGQAVLSASPAASTSNRQARAGGAGSGRGSSPEGIAGGGEAGLGVWTSQPSNAPSARGEVARGLEDASRASVPRQGQVV